MIGGMPSAPTSWRTSSVFAPKPRLRTGCAAPSTGISSNERWWRAIQTGAYRDWMKLQYGAALTGSMQLNKPSPPTDARRLDAQAMQTLKEVAAEFAYFNSAASEKNDVEGGSCVDFDFDLGGRGRSTARRCLSLPIVAATRRRFRRTPCLAIGGLASSRSELSAQSRRADGWRDGD